MCLPLVGRHRLSAASSEKASARGGAHGDTSDEGVAARSRFSSQRVGEKTVETHFSSRALYLVRYLRLRTHFHKGNWPGKWVTVPFGLPGKAKINAQFVVAEYRRHG
jgi:hypothetical protein